MSEFKTFDMLNVSSKFAICGLPLRVDSYKTCTFGCRYCFANERKIMETSKDFQIGDLGLLKRKVEKVFKYGNVNQTNFLEVLMASNITWHCGGMSDPFQPCEKRYGISAGMVNITKPYGVSILFSTKSDTVHDAAIDPALHTFQLSVTNTDERMSKVLEPNVPSLDRRREFFKNLKKEGFRVGIRIQPFIPDVTTLDVVKMFEDADHFSLEGLKMVPQNREQKQFIIETLGIDEMKFIQMGLMNLKPELRMQMYRPFIDYFEEHGISYSLADNDLHHLGNNLCCCGDKLCQNSTRFNTTAMSHLYGKNYDKTLLYKEIGGVFANCRCNQLFASNRQEGNSKTVAEFYDRRFERESSPFSPKFLYDEDLDAESGQLTFDF